ncbi:MAG: hypothetical protein HRT68_08885 [Flavobacteriaceae bacterium]|nr:hypothetical protein [Flavobacteriaceae bacterium]
MKKIIVLIILCISSIQCINNTNTKQEEIKSETSVGTKENLVGGWQSIEVNSVIKDLASYVKTEKKVDSPIKAISKASTQIVSGRNYRFEMTLENGEIWLAQVYVNLKQEKSITDFKKISN